MGDLVRRLLYPLLLPAIVAVIWFSGWVKQMDDKMGLSGGRPHTTHARPNPRDMIAADPVPYTDDSDVMATANDEPVIEY